MYMFFSPTGITVSDADLTLAWCLAVTVAVVGPETSLAVTLKFKLIMPAGTTIVAGVTNDVEDEASPTTKPPAGAGPVNSIRFELRLALLPIWVAPIVILATVTAPT
jgi:hypothetical protein